jgi:hypothetical protein
MNKGKMGGLKMKHFTWRKAVASMKCTMAEEHAGVVSFEYIIILVIMAVVVYNAWGKLSKEVYKKALEIANFIQNNGQTPLGTK